MLLPRSRDEYAVWLTEAIRGVGLARTSLVGMSYGGFLALNLALASPAIVDKLVLLAPGVRFAPPTRRWLWGMPMVLCPSPFTVRLFFERASVRGYPARDSELVQLTQVSPRSAPAFPFGLTSVTRSLGDSRYLPCSWWESARYSMTRGHRTISPSMPVRARCPGSPRGPRPLAGPPARTRRLSPAARTGAGSAP